MSLYSLDKILVTEDSNNDLGFNLSKITTTDTEFDNYSFVQEGYDFVIKMGYDYIAAEKAFCESVLGSHSDDVVINESFSDFFDKIKAIIRKFIEWIKKVFKEFVTKLNSFFASEKYLKKHKKDFIKFESKHEFEYNGYTFTKIDDAGCPVANAVAAFKDGDDNFFNSVGYDDTLVNGSDPDYTAQTNKMNDVIQAKIDSVNDNLDKFYDEFRGKVISKEAIDSSDFATELFELFRNEDSEPSKITIDHTYVQDALRRFENHKDTIKSIEKTQKDIIKSYEDLEKHLDKLIKLNKGKGQYDNALSFAADSSNSYTAGQIDVLKKDSTVDGSRQIYSSSTFDKMNTYLKVQSSKVNQMCSIHTQAFTAKLEAAKDCFKQDKAILYKALAKIQNKPTTTES